MKYQTVLLLAVGLMLPQAALADFDSTGQPLQCIGTDTFYPRGDRWAEPPGGSISLRFQPDGPTNQTGSAVLPGDIANQTIFNAFNVWSGVTCANGLQPDLRFALGPGFPDRSDGNNTGGTGTYQTVVYFAVTAGDQWPSDSLTVADTLNHYYEVNLVDAAADVIFNNINFSFRTTAATGAAYGCNQTSTSCYDLESVALHEVGHFLGFNHVACSNAVMYPSADNTTQTTTLSHHEQAGVCALYPPRTYAGTASTMGESCASVSDCLKGLSCLKPPGAAGTAATGWCAESCGSTSDCPIGWVCGPQGGSSNVCQPGIHLGGIAVTTVNSTPDLCAPCSDHSQCVSNLCGIDPATNAGICTQTCVAPDFACPQGFGCVATTNPTAPSVCWPNAQDTCSNMYQGAANDALCYLPASVSGAASDMNRACAGNGVCFVFPTSNTGDCVQPCTAGTPGIVCATGYTCCFDLDATGHCVTSEAGVAEGGCFKIRQPGQLCTTPSLSVCGQGSQCLSNTVGTDSAECYRVCAGDGTNNGCGVGETCVTSGTEPLCCDASRYDGTNLSTCWPVPAACTREVGVTCSSNADCASNFCLKGASGSVCTAACSSSNDCPGAGTDVNGDGQPDGGTTCQSIGSETVCMPIGAIAAAPACAAVASSSNHGGGGCTTVAVQDFAWTWAVVAAAWAARRAKNRTA